MSDYNGWTNWETWQVNLHFAHWFTEENFTPEEIQEIVTTNIQGATQMPDAGLLNDILNGFTGKVNWRELSDYYKYDESEEEEDEDDGE